MYSSQSITIKFLFWSWTFELIRTSVYFTTTYYYLWKSLYPSLAFPFPEDYPTMYPNYSYTRYYSDTSYIFMWACTNDTTCPHGPIDYACQMKHSCYLALIDLGIHVLAGGMILLVIVVALGKAFDIAYNFVTGVIFVQNVIEAVSSCMRCLSCGLLEMEITIQVDEHTKKKMSSRNQQIARQMGEYDVDVNFQALDKFQIRKIEIILEDYEVDRLEDKV